MATQTLAGADAILKNAYRGTIEYQLNDATYIVDQLTKANSGDLGDFTGRQLIFAIHTARNRGRQAGTDGGSLPSAGTQGTLDAIVAAKYFSQAIELTDQVIKQSATNEGAFVRALEFEMDRATTDMRKDVCRIAYGTGDGLLASCTATQAGVNTFSVDSGQYIAVGDPVDVLTRATGAVKASGVTVTAVTYTGTAGSATQANANITVSGGTISVTAADGVYVSGDRNLESDGLRNICSTGRTLHSINSSTNPIWDSNIKDATQANPSEDLYMQLSQTIQQRTGKQPDSAVTTFGSQRRLANTYGSQKRWNDDHVLKIDGGYSTVMIAAGNGAMPVIADVDCPNGTAFIINKAALPWCQLDSPDWLKAPDGEGGILHLKDGSTAGTKVRVWQAWMVWDAWLVSKAPARCGKLINVNDDVPVVRN